MPNPPAPASAIRLMYTCPRCGNKVIGARYSAPSSHLMGRVLMDEHVCQDCQKKHAEHLHGFWGTFGSPNGGQCAGCPKNMERGSSFVAYRSLKEDGTWQIARICEDCHVEYKTLCVKLAAGNTKK